MSFNAKIETLAWEHRHGWHEGLEHESECDGCPVCEAQYPRVIEVRAEVAEHVLEPVAA